jgi:hypothetical protein
MMLQALLWLVLLAWLAAGCLGRNVLVEDYCRHAKNPDPKECGSQALEVEKEFIHDLGAPDGGRDSGAPGKQASP